MARERVSPRDPEDWPVAAVALLLGIPIGTEDQDFFGTGIASWTTDKVELYLRNRQGKGQSIVSRPPRLEDMRISELEEVAVGLRLTIAGSY